MSRSQRWWSQDIAMPQASCVAADCDAEVPSYANRFDLLTRRVLAGKDPSGFFDHELQLIIYLPSAIADSNLSHSQ